MKPEVEGQFLRHESCENCGSSDAKAIYSNGSAYCFSCETYFPEEKEKGERRRRIKRVKYNTPLLDINQYAKLTKRRISEETCRKFGYGIGDMKGEPVQIAPYYNEDRELIAQHIRTRDKQFRWRGNSKGVLELFGQHLWRKNGKRLVITEGEIDCLTVAQIFNLNWATVSVPNGAQSALKYVKQNLEFVEGYEEVVIAFDNDTQGKKAAKEVAEILTAGKVKIANWSPYKDASDMMQKGKGGQIAKVIFEAKEYRPDGIVAGTDLTLEDLKEEEDIFSFEIPYPILNTKLKGIRKGEITTLTSGTGMGKTTLAKELGYHLFKNHNQKLGIVALEEGLKKSALSLIAMDNNIPAGDLFLDRTIIPDKKFEESYQNIIQSGNIFFYDHFGSLESENLMAKIKFLAVGAEVDFIIFDHISIAVSGIEGGDERRIIDNLMTKLRSVVESTGVGVILISHLKNPQGRQKSHEEGGRVTANQLRGSGAIKQISDNIIGVERDQQGENPDISTLRVLKNRLFGDTGLAGQMFYSKKTGRLTHHELGENTNNDFEDPFPSIENEPEFTTPKEIASEEKEKEENTDERKESYTSVSGDSREYPTPY